MIWSLIHCHCLPHMQITVNQTDKIAGTHTTPVKHYVDDLTMSFSESQEASGTVCTVNVSSLVSRSAGCISQPACNVHRMALSIISLLNPCVVSGAHNACSRYALMVACVSCKKLEMVLDCLKYNTREKGVLIGVPGFYFSAAVIPQESLNIIKHVLLIMFIVP